MTAKEFFEQQSTTDINNRIVDKHAHKYNRFDLMKFAQAYHENEVKKLHIQNVSNCYDRADMEYAYNADKNWQPFDKFIEEYDAPI